MDFNCHIKDCSSLAVMFCSCLKEVTLTCLIHIEDHVLSDESKDHLIRPIFKKVDESKRKAITVKTQEILQKIRCLKHTFKKEHAKALECMEKLKITFLSSFSQAKKVYQSILATTQIADKLLNVPHKAENRYIEADIENISKLIEDAHSILPDPKQVDPELKFFEIFLKNLFVTELEKPQESQTSDSVYFVKAEAKSVTRLTLDSLDTIDQPLVLSEALGLLAGLTLIPGDKLFYHGGYNGEGNAISSTYIINLQTNHVEVLPKVRLRCTASAIYNQGSVYIFGGYGKAALKQSDRFNLQKKVWQEIADLPMPTQNTSTEIIKGNILVSGLGSKILLYNTEKNAFDTIISSLNIGSFNILIKEGATIYLLSGGVYLSSEETLDKWLYTEKITEIISSTTCRPVIRDRFAYFVCQDGEVMKFSLDTLELIKIKQVFD